MKIALIMSLNGQTKRLRKFFEQKLQKVKSWNYILLGGVYTGKKRLTITAFAGRVMEQCIIDINAGKQQS